MKEQKTIFIVIIALSLFSFLSLSSASAQTYFCDFESYTVGQQLACQDSTNWTTWSLDPCNATEDPLISNAQAFSGTKSVVIIQNNDLVKPLGGATTGIHLITFKFYVPTGKSGYFNTLATFAGTASVWAMQVYFDVATSNNGRLFAGASTAIPFSYTHGSWQTAKVVANLNIDSAVFVVNGNIVHTWRYTAGTFGAGCPKVLDANNFFGAEATDEMYVDDYYYNPNTIWPTGVKQQSQEIPVTFALEQNYPNPFNPTTNIKFSIPTQGLVTLKVFNSLGKEVATLVNEVTNTGTYVVDFDAGNLTSGVYFYRLQSDNFSETKRMILIK